jgi:phosphatidylserine/phosphatidylglycerophosphate/cardiolipin synthase-like enzyme
MASLQVGHSNPSLSLPGITVYLNSPRAAWNADLPGHLTQFINSAKKSLDVAIYDLRDPKIVDALKNQNHKGTKIRIVYDAGKQRTAGSMGDPKPGGTDALLKQAGLDKVSTPIHETSGNLMHNKVIIRDGQSLWTGSANFTKGGLELQDNNCLAIDSPELVSAYEPVFQNLLSSTHSHPKQPPISSADKGSQSKSTAVSGTTITPFFSPAAGENVETTVDSELQKARRVRILAFLISDPGILQGLKRFESPGADIRGVYDPNGMNNVLHAGKHDPTLFWFMKDKRFVSAPSHPFNPKGEQDFMHNKVMILDDQKVITGSYNFSEHAESNDENLLVIDSKQVASGFTSYFEALYQKYGGKT